MIEQCLALTAIRSNKRESVCVRMRMPMLVRKYYGNRFVGPVVDDSDKLHNSVRKGTLNELREMKCRKGSRAMRLYRLFQPSGVAGEDPGECNFVQHDI